MFNEMIFSMSLFVSLQDCTGEKTFRTALRRAKSSSILDELRESEMNCDEQCSENLSTRAANGCECLCDNIDIAECFCDARTPQLRQINVNSLQDTNNLLECQIECGNLKKTRGSKKSKEQEICCCICGRIHIADSTVNDVSCKYTQSMRTKIIVEC